MRRQPERQRENASAPLLPVALLTEAVRQIFFGVTLGLAYPVLRARHGPQSARARVGARQAEPQHVPVA